MADEHPTKQCRKCETVKPLSDFYRNRKADDGAAAMCKDCVKVYQKSRTNLRPAAASGLGRLSRKAMLAEHKIAAARAARNKVAAEQKALALQVLAPALASVNAAVSAVETLMGALKAASAALEMLVGPKPAKAKPRTANGVRPAHPKPEAPPSIRTIKDIVADERVTLNEAKRIQEQEILARAEWRPSIIH